MRCITKYLGQIKVLSELVILLYNKLLNPQTKTRAKNRKWQKKKLLKHRTSRRTLEVSGDGEKRRVPSKETNLNELGNTLSKTCTKKALKKRKKKKRITVST